MPAEEVPPASGIVRKPKTLPVLVRLNSKVGDGQTGAGGWRHSVSRPLYRADGLYLLSMVANVCDSATTAQEVLLGPRGQSSAPGRPGWFAGRNPLGDESWIGPGETTALYRAGRCVAGVAAHGSNAAARARVRAVFPPAAHEAVAHAILVRLSRQPGLTGVTATHPPVAVMGKALPQDDAVEIAGRIYVRTGAAMAAAGWKHEWDAKTGVLVLRHSAWTQKTIALRALPAKGAENITVPLWSDGGQPMMLLTDLAATLKASMSRDAQGVYQVRGL